MELTDSIECCKGIGRKTAGYFEHIGIRTVGDLLSHYPAKYEEMPPVSKIGECEEGKVSAILCTLRSSIRNVSTGRGMFATVTVSDGTGSLRLGWFNQPYMASQLGIGSRLVFRGVVSRKQYGLTMLQPQYFSEKEYAELVGRPRPVYITTSGLSVKLIRKAVAQALNETGLPDDPLPCWAQEQYGLCGRSYAVKGIHQPQNLDMLKEARSRLVFDEFLAFSLKVKLLRSHEPSGTRHVFHESGWSETILKSLPYGLTGAQSRVWREILGDLQGGQPMNRLVQGDVGSGKTILAVLALATAVENGYQGVLMAPTEVLARQHFDKISSLLQKCGLPCRCIMATGSLKASEKKEARRMIASGEAEIVIGTHALFQEKVVYSKLGMVVTDEQHRFGVRQRAVLAGKGEDPHILVMSATPIPRTLALVLYGDLNVSTVDEKPAARLPIKNAVIASDDHDKAVRFMEKRIAEGRQAYVICPLVEESEGLDAEDVKTCAARLRKALPGMSVGTLHGRMRPADKQKVMEKFAAGELSVLVSTTVVEVGVDVPNATVMIIENAERFGLAQLHQLRGRIGRGKEQSYCIFVNGSEDGGENSRLSILQKENDGFRIAEEDLKLRGPGDFFGVRQSGEMDFVLGDVIADNMLLFAAAEAADRILKESGENRARDMLELYGETQADLYQDKPAHIKAYL